MSASTLRAISSVTELDTATSAALLHFCLAFADTKHMLGRRLSEWVTGAPAMEAAVAAANITQEELGHARSLFAMVRDLPGAPQELKSESDISRAESYYPAALQRGKLSWFEIITLFFLLDSALTSIIGTAAASRLAPLKQRVAKIQQEEHFHAVYFRGWMSQLAGGSPRAKDELSAAVTKFWPVAAAWFGPARDPVIETLVQSEILACAFAKPFQSWKREIKTITAEHGLVVLPDTPLNWDHWNATRREILHANKE